MDGDLIMFMALWVPTHLQVYCCSAAGRDRSYDEMVMAGLQDTPLHSKKWILAPGEEQAV